MNELIKMERPPASHLVVILLFLHQLQLIWSQSQSQVDNDQSVLLSFKAAISSDPSGFLTSWNTSIPLCQWAGVTCSTNTSRVSGLVLEHLSLAGTLSPSLANLTHLATLRLSGNMLTGHIPAIPSLALLDLSSNALQGTLPTQLLSSNNLTYLNLSRNSLTGSIPIPIPIPPSLTSLDLSSNNLTGQIPPQLGSFTSLIRLQLSSNSLEGAIPSSLGNLSRLSTLDLSKNNLRGELPPHLGNLISLVFFKVSNNMLSGSIPSSIYNLSALNDLVLYGNLLSGELPSDIGASLPNLRVLSMYNNQLSGLVPNSLANASRLEEIDLSQNHFSGKIPSNFGMLKNLTWLALEHNQLEAREASDWDFIQSLANCSLLDHLSLDTNNLTGNLPSSVGNLSTELSWLSLWDNQLTGEIPLEIANLVNLNTLGLKGNRFSGKIPNSIGQLSNLGALILFGNQLSGGIPSSIGNLTRLNECYLDHNQLQGEIPSSIGKCQNLIILDLSHNRLSGTIPKELLSLSSLSYYLSLSHNLLSGPLPPEVARLQSLSYLDLSYNKLSDRIPDSLGQCLVLENLAMSNNLFNGSIPVSFKNLRGLKDLDLSHNNLLGDFPDYLADFPYLEHVDLSFNALIGKVPTSGIFANRTAVSVVGNNQVCGGISSLDLPACPEEAPKKKKHLVVLIVVPVVCGILLIILVPGLYIACISKRNLTSKRNSFRDPLEGQFLNLSYAELAKATDDFSFDNLIGVGTYGSVFKGNLGSGELIAVKVLDLQQQGASKSFMAECEALRNIRHRNLLKILTVCSSVDNSGREFKAMVFEFMPNGNLDMWVHPKVDQKVGSRSLTLAERVNIAVDVATGLNYLHNLCATPVVHCDLKPSNVLLDENMTAHIADFGLVRFLQKINGKGYRAPFTSVAAMGSIGYVPPEYGVGNHASPQGDVYSYGVLLIELFIGKRPTDTMFKDGLTLQMFVENQLSNGSKATQIVDASFLSKESLDLGEMLEKCLQLILKTGLSCAKVRPRERIKIKDVVRQLEEVREFLLL
ncbi:Leucine-rich receptor-like protein kinase family protein [Rhynchospora pubera]|uniref:Receptor kinase-like protein Xa21 n=1 Tax=Rhynchospora pubera TaxID=906938 RepID=A0AAV8EHP0_9POAL|nr:Leucine-rich receptor-like protein kinase family protein [Rhynchospora pubera]